MEDNAETPVVPAEERRMHLRRAEDLQLLHYRTRSSEIAIKEMQAAMMSIEKSLATLVSYEGRMQTLSVQVHGVMTYQDLLKNLHFQQDKTSADIQARLKNIELQMPMLLAVRGWVINAALGVLALVGAAVAALVSNAH